MPKKEDIRLELVCFYNLTMNHEISARRSPTQKQRDLDLSFPRQASGRKGNVSLDKIESETLILLD